MRTASGTKETGKTGRDSKTGKTGKDAPQTKAEKTKQNGRRSGKNWAAGHRQRLRRRFLADCGQNMPDYELIELLLTFALPRRDVKPLAKTLLEEYRSLPRLLAAGPERLAQPPQLGEAARVLVKLCHTIAQRTIRRELDTAPVLSSWETVIDYCHATLAYEQVEILKLFLLNRNNRLLSEENIARGTIDRVAFYQREIIKRALEKGASALIIVHNHPGGSSEPSAEDIRLTREIQKSAAGLNLVLHDHIIISSEGATSLRTLGFLHET